MFGIKFRITENIDLIKHAISVEELELNINNVCGVFQLQIGSQKIGFFMDEELPEGVYGSEIINLWFSLLLELIIRHEKNCENSMMINVAYDSWIKFDFNGNFVEISGVNWKDESCSTPLVMDAGKFNFQSEWIEKNISYLEMKSEVKTKLQMFIAELGKLNPLTLEMEEIRLLIKDMNKVDNLL